MSNKAIIFDLDGTLIDSLKDIAICANKVLREFNLPTHKIEDYKKFVGGGAKVLIKNCTPKDISEDLINKLVERFKEIYDQNLHGNTKPYNGINELLLELHNRGIKIGVLSNKPHEFTIKYVNEFFFCFNIQEVHGQKQDIPKKPNPIAALDIASSFKIECKNIYFVGDTDVDMQTAKNAGMNAIGVEWGFRDIDELLEHGADYIANTPLDILKIIE